MKFALGDAERAEYPVAALCRSLRVSRAGFYAWRSRAESQRAKEDRRLRVLVRDAHERGRKAYGSPRVLVELTEQGERISRKRVIRLMQAEGLKARVRRRYRSTTMREHDQSIAPNLLDREFHADAPNQRWVGDTSEFAVANGGRIFLAAIVDLFSRFAVAGR